MGKTPGEMHSAIMANLQAKTGKSLEDWSRQTARSGPKERKDRVAWLMNEHGLGRVAANIIAAHADGSATDYTQGAALVDAMFAGPKAALRPVYDAVAAKARALGADVTVWPCKTQVTFRRKRQFAWVKPSTKTRLDLGLALPGVAPGGRLQTVTGADDDDRVRLRIPLASAGEVDREVARWLKKAYDFDA